MTARETAGQVLRRWREAAGIGLREMAGLVACSPSFLTDIERGNRGLPRPRIMDFVVSYAPPERRGELLCELWAALDDRPWYRVDEVPPPKGIALLVIGTDNRSIPHVCKMSILGNANIARASGRYWTRHEDQRDCSVPVADTDYWCPLGRGPGEGR